MKQGYEAAKRWLNCEGEELECLLDDPLSGPDKSLDALLDDALLARDLNHALSVMGYAVRSGRKGWFHNCLHRIRQKVRHETVRAPANISIACRRWRLFPRR